MIPTTHRFKLPKYIAFPVGAEMLSAALVTVPQYGELSVTFIFYGSAAALLESAKRGEPLPVLSAEYTPWRPNPAGGPPLDLPEWRLWVRPVPSVQKSGARRALLNTGVARVSAWLSSPRSPTWLAERHTLEVKLRCPELTIEFEES